MSDNLLCPKCKSANVKIESALIVAATRSQPAEYLHRGVCGDCGETSDYDDLEEQEDD